MLWALLGGKIAFWLLAFPVLLGILVALVVVGIEHGASLFKR